jgi:hypothetical protein
MGWTISFPTQIKATATNQLWQVTAMVTGPMQAVGVAQVVVIYQTELWRGKGLYWR